MVLSGKNESLHCFFVTFITAGSYSSSDIDFPTISEATENA